MEKHRKLIAPKFEKVLEIFKAKLSGLADVSWTRPKGGYFITLYVPKGCAKRVVALAKEAGVELTPYRMDPDDRAIRVAPTFPDLSEVAQATEGVALCVQLAVAEKMAESKR